MTPHDIELVRNSFTKLIPNADDIGLAFYANLFTANPELRPLFPEQLVEQSRKLMLMLASLVSVLDQPGRLETLTRSLGARHRRYGVQDGHYAQVGAALLETLREGLQDDFNAATEAAWAAAYGALAERMVAAADEAVA